MRFLTPVLISLATAVAMALGRLLLRSIRALTAELRSTRSEIGKLPAQAELVGRHTMRLNGIDLEIVRLTDDVAELKSGYESLRNQLVALVLPTQANRSEMPREVRHDT